jgi:hypothetical protein
LEVVGDGNCEKVKVFLILSLLWLLHPETQPTAGHLHSAIWPTVLMYGEILTLLIPRVLVTSTLHLLLDIFGSQSMPLLFFFRSC